MLTVDFGRFQVGPGDRVLDLGCGGGRHAFEAFRRGAAVIALDRDETELSQVRAVAAAMAEAGEPAPGAHARAVRGDATAMPFSGAAFDRVIASEVLEHVHGDQRALAEIARVLRPGGLLAVTVPAWLPERVCWWLSAEYPRTPGGHVRIYTRPELEAKLRQAGLAVTGHHHAHGLHSPYWWLKCAVGVHDDSHPLAQAYHRLLVWDIMKRPALTRAAERALNPLIGKSLVVYARKPVRRRTGARSAARNGQAAHQLAVTAAKGRPRSAAAVTTAVPTANGHPSGARAVTAAAPGTHCPSPNAPVTQAAANAVLTGQHVPAVPGVLTEADVRATAGSIAAVQRDTGAVPWPDGHTDAWNHVECLMALSATGLGEQARRGYDWLRRTQRADGSWPRRTGPGGEILDGSGDTNQAAYVATGVWHEYLLTGDAGFVREMWPVVRRAIGFTLALRAPGGEIVWERDAAGAPGRFALLTGCASIHQSLRCGALLAGVAGERRPDWEEAAGRLAEAVARRPSAFADKSRFSMDWYYPVLAGPVRGQAAAARLATRWAEFVVPGLGARCVSDQPWVTGAETCELVLALDAAGDTTRARELFTDIQHLRHTDGSYWTGWQFADRAHFPAERSAWTAAAVILAADALSGATAAAGLFRGAAAVAPAR